MLFGSNIKERYMEPGGLGEFLKWEFMQHGL
jgi:hypothetical protein